jgi:hypothetical protein
MKAFWTFVICMLLAATTYAQPAPPPDGGAPGGPGGPGGGGPDRGQQDGPGPRGRGMMRGGDGPGGGGFGGPGMPGGPGGGGFGAGMGPGANGPMRQFEVMRGYLEVVDRYTKISNDPTSAGIAAVVAAADVLKPRGADAAIEYFTKLLPDVKDPAVARAIHSQLADLYKQSGQQDKALDQLKTLITGAPSGSSSPKQ